MTVIKIRAELLSAFAGCVLAGVDGMGERGGEITACIALGESPLEGSDVGFAVFEVPDNLMDDLRSAFVAGREGLHPGDGVSEMADAVGRVIGAVAPAPAP